jgi:hypothetical protein
MAIKQSAWATGQKQAPFSREANGVVVERFTYTINADLAIGDIIELGVLPAYHFPVDAVLVTGAMGTSDTADVGIMSGTVGDAISVRTCGAELFDDLDVATAKVSRPSAASAFAIQPANVDRSIGFKANTEITAAGQIVTLVLTYAQ